MLAIFQGLETAWQSAVLSKLGWPLQFLCQMTSLRRLTLDPCLSSASTVTTPVAAAGALCERTGWEAGAQIPTIVVLEAAR